MMKRCLVMAAVAAALLAGSSVSPVHAQDVQVTGPLAGAPAVRHMRIFRQGRIQLQPFIGFTLQDEYSRTMLVGAQVNYHLTDWLGIGVWGGFGAIHIDAGLTDQVGAQGQTTTNNTLSLPNRHFFSQQIGKLSWMVAPQVTFIPLRGKLALFQKIFVDTDFYVFGGVAFVGVEERANTDVATAGCMTPPPPDADESNTCVASATARASRVAIAPTFGAGLTFYINQWMGVSIEWRGMPFAWNTSGTDEAGSGPGGNFPDGFIDGADQIFHFNHMVNIGFTIYLPTKARISE